MDWSLVSGSVGNLVVSTRLVVYEQAVELLGRSVGEAADRWLQLHARPPDHQPPGTENECTAAGRGRSASVYRPPSVVTCERLTLLIRHSCPSVRLSLCLFVCLCIYVGDSRRSTGTSLGPPSSQHPTFCITFSPITPYFNRCMACYTAGA